MGRLRGQPPKEPVDFTVEALARFPGKVSSQAADGAISCNRRRSPICMWSSAYLCACPQVMIMEDLDRIFGLGNRVGTDATWLGLSQSLAPVTAAADFASGLCRIWKALVLCDPRTLSSRRGVVLPLAEQVDGMKARPPLVCLQPYGYHIPQRWSCPPSAFSCGSESQAVRRGPSLSRSLNQSLTSWAKSCSARSGESPLNLNTSCRVVLVPTLA